MTKAKKAVKDKYIPLLDPEYLDTDILKLACVLGGKEQITTENVLKILKKYIFYYLKITKAPRARISTIFDLLIDAEEFAKNNQIQLLLASISLIFFEVSFDSLKLEEIRASHKKGGMHSPWVRHHDVICLHLKKYHSRKYKNKKEAMSNIEMQTGLTLNPDTFDSWWKKYKNNIPLFQLTNK